MTLTVTISHKSGDSYAAKVQQQGKPDTVIQPGESQDFHMYGCATTNLTISETSATKPEAVVNTTGNAEQAAASTETPVTDTAPTGTEGAE